MMRRAKPCADGAAECSACGFEMPAPHWWLCDECRTCICARCLPSMSLHHLTACTRAALAARLPGPPAQAEADRPPPSLAKRASSGVVLGEWPAVDQSGRPFAWFVWTGTNQMPAYLELCIETFRRRAGSVFHVRLVRHHELAELLGDSLHPAYELLSYVHRADYLRCELLHAYGGLYCDCDTVCVGNLAPALVALGSASAVLVAEPAMIYEAGINAALCRRDSTFTRCWRASLHARLDARMHALRTFRADGDTSPTEDPLEWNEILRDLVAPLCAALDDAAPRSLSWSLNAFNWNPERVADSEWGMSLGFDPLAWSASMEPTVAPELQLIVLNNNQYGERLKRATHDEVLQSGSVLASWLQPDSKPRTAPDSARQPDSADSTFSDSLTARI
mmetsp:Transcript_23831/g.80490  ORF Transcript_23831/g.80490 Transcript_23831/m.80490 type:complete len:392 (+) Transcript_23831:2460-3635(+)